MSMTTQYTDSLYNSEFREGRCILFKRTLIQKMNSGDISLANSAMNQPRNAYSTQTTSENKYF